MPNDTTPAPIGADAVVAQLRHLYRNMVEGGVRDTAQAKRIAEGLLSPAIAALERAALASAAQPAARHVGESKFETWFGGYSPPAHAGTKQMMRDAYAAGMGDPGATAPKAAPAAQGDAPGRWLVVNIGCIECGVSTALVGRFDSKEIAQAVANECAHEHGWREDGQNDFEVFDLDAPCSSEYAEAIARAANKGGKP